MEMPTPAIPIRTSPQTGMRDTPRGLRIILERQLEMCVLIELWPPCGRERMGRVFEFPYFLKKCENEMLKRRLIVYQHLALASPGDSELLPSLALTVLLYSNSCIGFIRWNERAISGGKGGVREHIQ
jgi:hypothetical protein